ncbi:ATP-grasp domain-containing protein [Nesterenkonia jeotgali]|uniref:Cyanophycin synthetase n=1 Tax=Nesterenkonia jeotgali TaxID=317018 RepID=A0A839FUU1_9MICC|nr:ATP-grasp domain-containing protein [Nesterenkonia jeotgali]MBA8920547.1 cyanophycin synthetase [Nesterenkonia jeotgali]
MNQETDAQADTPESVNVQFVEQHLRDRWLRFNEGGQELSHTDAILAAASARELTFQRTGKNVLMFDGDRCVGGVMGATPSMNSSFSQLVASSKLLTKSVLRRAGVPSPPARQFTESEWTQASDYLLAQSGRRQVVKPSDGRQGLGITTGVKTQDHLLQAWPHAMQASPAGRVLIEAEVPGVDVRILVIRGRAEAAATRIPPFVVGDGRHSILELTEDLRAARMSHVYLKDRVVKVDGSYLERHQLAPGDVLGDGEVQFLNGTANLSQGGVSVDLTDSIPAAVMSLAESASASIPGLNFAGVDILMPDPTQALGASVIEVNTSPNLLVHEAPAYGQPRGVAHTVVQSMIDSGLSQGERNLPETSAVESSPAKSLLSRMWAARIAQRRR